MTGRNENGRMLNSLLARSAVSASSMPRPATATHSHSLARWLLSLFPIFACACIPPRKRRAWAGSGRGRYLSSRCGDAPHDGWTSDMPPNFRSVRILSILGRYPISVCQIRKYARFNNSFLSCIRNSADRRYDTKRHEAP